jgi:hypothetical protein
MTTDFSGAEPSQRKPTNAAKLSELLMAAITKDINFCANMMDKANTKTAIEANTFKILTTNEAQALGAGKAEFLGLDKSWHTCGIDCKYKETEATFLDIEKFKYIYRVKEKKADRTTYILNGIPRSIDHISYCWGKMDKNEAFYIQLPHLSTWVEVTCAPPTEQNRQDYFAERLGCKFKIAPKVPTGIEVKYSQLPIGTIVHTVTNPGKRMQLRGATANYVICEDYLANDEPYSLTIKAQHLQLAAPNFQRPITIVGNPARFPFLSVVESKSVLNGFSTIVPHSLKHGYYMEGSV